MNLLVVQRILGMLLVIFSLTMLPPVGVSLYYQDGNAGPFLDAFFALVAAGVLIWLPARKKLRDLRLRDGFMVVALFWIVLGFAGALPLILSDKPDISLTDAVFEAVSGFTTTGATVLVGLDDLPRSILYYRQQIQWLGGIGMVVLAVALLPMLGVGGMQLLKAESPGPVKDTRLKPRITETAKTLWIVYVAITASCAFGYWLAGMTPFDAIGHSFSTVSTGGYSTHDANMKYFNSTGIETVAVIFMFVGAVNFSLHFMAWRYGRLKDYLHDPEFRVFVAILVAGVTFGTLTLWLTSTAPSPAEAFRRAIFQTVSMQTTTGFRTDSFATWPGALPVTLILATFVGGCAGSAAGGMKIIRWMLMWKQGTREIVRLVHPSAELPVKIGNKAVEWRIIDAVWGFFAVYVVCFAVLMVSLMGTGEDQVTAFSAIASCINNAGPALGDVHDGFASLNPFGKWICVIAMLFGRLEIYPLLVLLTPTFWRR
jgi:trk system potassium uptake protein TrkH